MPLNPQPLSADGYESTFKRAMTCHAGGDSAQALSLIEQLLSECQQSQALLHLADTYAHYPNTGEIFYKIALLLQEQRRFHEAEYYYRIVLQQQPEMNVARNNLAVVLYLTGRYDEAESQFRKALSNDSQYGFCAWNLSTLLLSQARYEEGWPLYEQRYHSNNSYRIISPEHYLSFPRWQGESLAGKSLVIWPEQGLGDQIQFARYGKMLKQRGVVQLTVVCDAPLPALLLTAPGFDSVLSLQQAQTCLPPHDFWVLPLSLPLLCHETPESIPAELPYLWAWSLRHSAWLERLPERNAADVSCLVGIVWQGSRYDHRSLAGLSELKPLWEVAGIRFISLQKGEGEQEALDASTGDDQPLTALGGELRDMADTAAVIAELDLVISIDSAVAHLAGALGKPVWVLLSAIGVDWRWLHDRCDSPWYPGVMRLFRQQTPGNWATVIEQVKQALADFIRQPPELTFETREPLSAQQCHTLAEIAEDNQEDEIAADLFLQALELTPSEDLRRHERVLRSLIALKRAGELTSAITLAETEMPHWHHSPDFFFVLGDLMLDWALRNPDQALNEILPIVETSWLKCLEIGEQPNLQGSVAGRGSHLAAHNLAVFYESLGNSAQAGLFKSKYSSNPSMMFSTN